MAERRVETIWQDVWRPLLCVDVGLSVESLDFDAVKRELYDYYHLRMHMRDFVREYRGSTLSSDREGLENDIRGWHNDTPLDRETT